jgi:hypothetical protein
LLNRGEMTGGTLVRGPKMTPHRVLKVVEDTPDVRKQKGRSRTTNHKDLLPGLDGRSSAARRFRDLVSAFITDMGGLDQCSDIKLGLLRRLAAVTVQSELIEARMINGEAVDIGTLCTLASTSVRLATRLSPSLERVAKEVGPTLTDIIRADRERQRQALVQQP